jgi:gamma-glutamyltranspeptidase / glutathione hydrolase
MKTITYFSLALLGLFCGVTAISHAGSEPLRTPHGMVISVSGLASQVGADTLSAGGNAMDAAIATAFALAVTYPAAGNIGGGGFLLYSSENGTANAYDFRETAPAGAHPDMFKRDQQYDFEQHHTGHRSVAVPGTVAGLYMAWQDHGSLPWAKLLAPAIGLAKRGFILSESLASSLQDGLESMQPYPAAMAQFSNNGQPLRAGARLRQVDLAKTLQRIAKQGPDAFYRGEIAVLLEQEMRAHGGLLTRQDLAAYQPKRREPLRGSYRGYELLTMPPPSSGGVAVLQALNVLEGFDLQGLGHGSAQGVHLIAEAMRRAFSTRARYLGDPDFNTDMPVARLISKPYAIELRRSIDLQRASKSAPADLLGNVESPQTTHLSVIDSNRNAAALTYTLEWSYGSGIVAAGTGFLLNNEMGDFNAGKGLTDTKGLIGTDPNLAQAGKRMLSSMSPTIVLRENQLFMVTGSPGGRTIINTVLLTLINVIDFQMNAQEAVDAGRFHHQWLPDRLSYERFALSPDTMNLLKSWGHELHERGTQGAAAVIVLNPENLLLEGGVDRRDADARAVYSSR